MNGFLLIDKKEGWTSRDVCNKISNLLGDKRVGHTGTLDPFATGLLIVAVGKATKALTYFKDDKKEYIASLKLGIKTDSGDKTGKVIENQTINKVTESQIKEVFSSLIGKQSQIPPMASAIHFNGQKLYDLHRQGIEVERQARSIEIFELELINFIDDIITFRCLVSKGTYIRVLGEDIANKLNNIGHLLSLRRTKINDIDVNKAYDVLDIDESKIYSTVEALNFLSRLEIDDAKVAKVKNGVPLELKVDSDIVLLVDQRNNPLSVYKKKDDGLFYCDRGLW